MGEWVLESVWQTTEKIVPVALTATVPYRHVVGSWCLSGIAPLV